jgi:hypothetical protein
LGFGQFFANDRHPGRYLMWSSEASGALCK